LNFPEFDYNFASYQGQSLLFLRYECSLLTASFLADGKRGVCKRSDGFCQYADSPDTCAMQYQQAMQIEHHLACGLSFQLIDDSDKGNPIVSVNLAVSALIYKLALYTTHY
jgi:hypothetical protein